MRAKNGPKKHSHSTSKSKNGNWFVQISPKVRIVCRRKTTHGTAGSGKGKLFVCTVTYGMTICPGRESQIRRGLRRTIGFLANMFYRARVCIYIYIYTYIYISKKLATVLKYCDKRYS